ncbi:protein ALP1-like [Tripterygium wilfordii]|uniref:protein ALP1-like n=1 Tax=Tripterygium wilfordii TaxID=458696 RepID=UPI0018F7F973|nr:protein ALP1-like [Tripterygium wilfordii]
MGGHEFDDTDDDDEYDEMDDDEYDDECELNPKRTNDFILLASVTAAAIYHRRRRVAFFDKMSCRTSKLQGAKWVAEILHGHPDRCYQTFRMKKEIFGDLCYQLRDKYMLRTSNYVQIPEMVGMFLFILGHCAGNILVQECFQHSGETVSRMFHEVLHSVYLLSLDIIKPRENQFEEIPVKIRSGSKYNPFKNCVGAIDGTHIPAVIPKSDRGRFIGRKGTTTQNVMAACDFDMLYIFVSAGWEGSAHDARVFQDAISTP